MRRGPALLWCLLSAGLLAGLARSAHSTAGDANGAWIEMPPPALSGHVAVFDSLRNRLVTYDGRASGEVWIFDFGGGGWGKRTTEGTPPPASEDFAAVLDPARDRLLVIGYELWALDLDHLRWSQLPFTGVTPFLQAHSAVYDPVRDRVVLYSGPIPGVWTLSLGDTLAWTEMSATGTPYKYGGHAIYDPVRDRMVVFGGGSPEGAQSAGHEVWALPLSGTPVWTQIVPPQPLDDMDRPFVAYDPDGDRMLVMGGIDTYYSEGGLYSNAIFALALGGAPQWSEVPVTSHPLGRWNHAGAYDTRAHRLVICGGSLNTETLTDTWSVNLTGTPIWTALAGVAPLGRANHMVAQDTKRGRMVVFGGRRLPCYGMPGCSWYDLNDVGVYENEGWVGFAPQGTPAWARSSGSMIYDPVRDRMIVFGGRAENTPMGGLWSLSLSDPPTWIQLAPTGTAPSPRFGHSAVYDPLGDRMLVFGGSTGAGLSNEVWSLSLAGVGEWSLLAPSGAPPSPRYAQVAVYDSLRSRVLITGGNDGTALLSDTWSLSLAGSPAWSQTFPIGARAISNPAGAYDAANDQIVVVGESGAPRALLLAENVWRDMATTGTRLQMYGESACYDPVTRRILLFGGGGAYAWHYQYVQAIQLGAPTVEVTPSAPRAFAFDPPRPNPSTSLTRLRFVLPEPGPCEVRVFDLAGRALRTWREAWAPAGSREVAWDGRDPSGRPVPPGVYLARIQAGERQAVRRIVRVR